MQLNKIILFGICIISSKLLTAQLFSKKLLEAMAIEKTRDSIGINYFLDTSYFPGFRQSISKTRYFWTNFEKSNTKEFNQFFDIRFKFQTKDSATWFYKEYLDENNEDCIPIKKHKLTFEGASNYDVYKSNGRMEKMLGLTQFTSYCFLFTVNNFYIKLFVTCNAKTKPQYFQNYINAAIEKAKK